ncbi:hypothetical protein GCM10009347_27190 [Shewanella algicola]|uniref:DUF3634 family protein n=1 Tax=Shewanella algicola TaxID=640633 RepID=A0A9X1Z589_9GAMM|nr:DUF3634 family protein [Shewanella algicola]MCL1106416.1 DUF3634 family protein [Shewanella algicola]GGP59348.1 hypothetical protein GCM10009347_27190 [Shewanella algicola]
MADNIIKILIIVGLFFLAYKLIFTSSRGLTLFEMHFKDGKLTNHKGKIPERFERECRAIAKSNKLTCTIRAEKSGHVRLHVSANVGDNLIQQIRNQFPFEYYDKKQQDSSKLKG